MSISYHDSREVYEEEMGCSSNNRITAHKGISYLKGARQTCCQSHRQKVTEGKMMVLSTVRKNKAHNL